MRKIQGSKFFLLFLFLFLLFFRFLTFSWSSTPNSGTKIKVEGVVREEPKRIGGLQKFSLAGIKITTFRYPEYHYGDRLVVVGRVKAGVLEFPEIEKREEAIEGGLGSKIFNLRRKFEAIFRRSLPEPHASLFSGIVLGTKSEMPQDFYNDLRKTGTLHTVVASGMNVSILAGTTVSFLTLFVSRRIAAILSFILICFYVFLTGAEVPVVRAGIMGSLSLLAAALGRETDAWRGLGVAAFLILFQDPRNFFDLGFQLSFLATAGILFFGPLFSRLFQRLPNQLRSDISQTLGAQLATLPVLILNFGSYSPFSPLVNVLVVWVLPWIMRLGILAVIGGFLFFGLGQIISWLTFPFLTYFIWVVRVFSKF